MSIRCSSAACCAINSPHVSHQRTFKMLFNLEARKKNMASLKRSDLDASCEGAANELTYEPVCQGT